jgi:hypothetical protein
MNLPEVVGQREDGETMRPTSLTPLSVALLLLLRKLPK